MNYHQGRNIFKGVVCPHCGESFKFHEPVAGDMFVPLKDLYCNSAIPEYHVFSQSINDLLSQIAEGKEDFLALSAFLQMYKTE